MSFLHSFSFTFLLELLENIYKFHDKADLVLKLELKLLFSYCSYQQSDARALRVVLSLTGVKEGLRGHVVVEMSDLDNEPLVKLVGGELIETVVAHDVIGRLMIQCALQPGLAQVLNPFGQKTCRI